MVALCLQDEELHHQQLPQQQLDNHLCFLNRHGMNLTMQNNNQQQQQNGMASLRHQQQRPDNYAPTSADEHLVNGTAQQQHVNGLSPGSCLTPAAIHGLYAAQNGQSQSHVAVSSSRSQSTSSSGSGDHLPPASLLQQQQLQQQQQAQNALSIATVTGIQSGLLASPASQQQQQQQQQQLQQQQLQQQQLQQQGLLHGLSGNHYGNLVSAIGSLGRSPPPLSGNTSLRRFSCKLCPSMFDSKAELQLHTQVHMREAKPYKCTNCPKSFANSSYLSQHMRIHLGIKPFGPCQYCGRKFTQLSHLQQHLRTHTGEKPYKCRYPGCEKAFSQLSNLQSHSRCHQTDKPFKCNSCYKCFTDEAALLDHIPKHKDSKHLKVHICPYCGKSYTQATYLAKHMTKHSEKRDRDVSRLRVSSDDSMWSTREAALCGIHGIHDGCGDVSPTAVAAAAALPFNSFPAHNHHGAATLPSQNCAYSVSTMAGMTAAADPTSAFTRLGLGSLGARMAAANSRNPYFSYEPFKQTTQGLNHHGYIPTTFHNQFIRLDDIRNYSANMPTVSDFNMLMGKREPREAY